MNVVATDVAFQVRLRRRPHADLVRGTDDDDVADHESRRAVADARLVVDLAAYADHEIDDAVLAEARHRPARVGIERREMEPRRHDQQALVAGAVAPVGGAAPRGLARRAREALLAVVRPPDPQELAALRVDGDDVASDAGLRVEHAVDHQRRRLVASFGPRAVVARVEPPGDLELAGVARIDLVERRIALRGEVTAVEPPLDVVARRPPAGAASAAAAAAGTAAAEFSPRLCRRRAAARQASTMAKSQRFRKASRHRQHERSPRRRKFESLFYHAAHSGHDQKTCHEVEGGVHDHGREQTAGAPRQPTRSEPECK